MQVKRVSCCYEYYDYVEQKLPDNLALSIRKVKANESANILAYSGVSNVKH